MATADLLWKGLERDIFLAYTGEKMVKTEESGNIAMEIMEIPWEIQHSTGFPITSPDLSEPRRSKDRLMERTVATNELIKNDSRLGCANKELAISAS